MAWSSTFVRGNTYYLEDGNYGSKLFQTPLNGTERIIIKKATITDHATSVGWNAGMGDGQAIITAPLRFRTGYHTLNGQIRNEADWFDGNAYGIVIRSASNFNQPSIKVGGLTSTGALDLSGAAAHGCEFHYVFVDAAVMPSTAVRSYQFDTESGTSTTGFVVSRSYVKNGNNHFFLRNTTGALVEYTGSELAKNSTENHGEIYNLFYNAHSAVIRYNIARNNYDAGYSENAQGYYAGTAIAAIVTSSNCSIYGNLWYNNATTDGSIGWRGTRAGYEIRNLRVYNNTIIGGWGEQGVHLETGSTGCVVQNNIWFGNSPTFSGCSRSYNAGQTTLGEATGQAITSSIFVNYTGRDYRLASATAAGAPLASPHDRDMFGNTRGADGNWDRGAFEFGTIKDTTPPVISNLRSTSVTSTNAVIAWTTDEPATAIVDYGTTTSYGLSVSRTSLAVSHNITLSQLSAGTTYNYRVRTTDAAGNTRTSANATFTTIAVDTTPPQVTLTAPIQGATVSNAVTLTATASDNVGVVGVRFFINGAQVADVSSSPYAHVWDSTMAANGQYSIYAQARDAAGNTRSSGTNIVTVSNAPVPLPSAIAYFNFDEGSGLQAGDRVSTNRLTLRNGATWTTAGRFGNGLLLDGLNDRADAPNSPSLDIKSNTMSAAAWVKLENLGTWQQIIVKVKETGAFTPPFFAWHLFGAPVSATEWRPQFQLATIGQTGGVNVSSSINVKYGEWVHVAGVYDGTMIRIFVNGVEMGTAAQSGNIISYNEPLYIGAHGLPGEFAKGAIDEVRIYSQALSASQVRALYTLDPLVSDPITAPARPKGLRVVQ
ncbi:MAG: LamG-like jellyroll fold domain-containing protein [Limisphaerales bacterium]